MNEANISNPLSHCILCITGIMLNQVKTPIRTYLLAMEELESQDGQDSIGVSGIEVMVMPIVCMKIFQ